MTVQLGRNGCLCCLLLFTSILTTVDGINAAKCYPKNRTPFKFTQPECAVPLVVIGGYACLGTILILGSIMTITCCAQCSFCFDQRVPDNWIGLILMIADDYSMLMTVNVNSISY